MPTQQYEVRDDASRQCPAPSSLFIESRNGTNDDGPFLYSINREYLFVSDDTFISQTQRYLRDDIGGVLTMPAQLPGSKHFQIERLAEGVYAAVASEQGYAICNAGVVDIGDKTIIFDAFISPEAAKDLLKVSRQLTSHKATFVVNSHYHEDHIRGNQVFSPDVDIISTIRTRDAIAQNEPEEISWEKENIPKRIIDAQQKLDAEKDPERRRELAFSIVYYRAMIESHSQLRTRLPNVTFEHKLVIHGTRRTVELLPFVGHTASDVVLYLPEEEIAFMSDLLFINIHPYLPSGFPADWKQSLNKIGALGIKTAVPGHGPVGRSADLSVMAQYIQSLETIATNMVKSGKSIKEVYLQPVPSPFKTWRLLFDNFFFANLEFLYKCAFSGKGEKSEETGPSAGEQTKEL
jgi:cyclase